MWWFKEKWHRIRVRNNRQAPVLHHLHLHMAEGTSWGIQVHFINSKICIALYSRCMAANRGFMVHSRAV